MMYIHVDNIQDLFNEIEFALKKINEKSHIEIVLDFIPSEDEDIDNRIYLIDRVLDVLDNIANEYETKVETEYSENCCRIDFENCYLLFYNLSDPPYLSIVRK